MTIRPTTTRHALRCAAAMALAAFTTFACSGGSTGTSGTSGAPSGGACGLSLAWKANGSACDAWMTGHCCSQEQACAANGSCASFVSCVDACPLPRKDACINACGTGLPAGVQAIGACSKQTTPAVDAEIPSGCEWP